MGKLLLLLLSLSLGLDKIDGYVYDKNTGEYLCGVKVVSLNDTTYTDLNGYFSLKNVYDTTNIKFELISYETIDTTIINNNLLIISEKQKN